MGADRPRPFAASCACGLPPARLSSKWNRSRTGCQALLTQELPAADAPRSPSREQQIATQMGRRRWCRVALSRNTREAFTLPAASRTAGDREANSKAENATYV